MAHCIPACPGPHIPPETCSASKLGRKPLVGEGLSGEASGFRRTDARQSDHGFDLHRFRVSLLESLDRLRQTLGYEATLERGYAVVWAGDKVVTTAKAAGKAKELEIQFADGRHAPGAAAKAPRTVVKPAKPDAPDQGSLF